MGVFIVFNDLKLAQLCCGCHVGVMCSPQEEVLVEDSAEAEGVVPTDSQDGVEASQVGHHLI